MKLYNTLNKRVEEIVPIFDTFAKKYPSRPYKV